MTLPSWVSVHTGAPLWASTHKKVDEVPGKNIELWATFTAGEVNKATEKKEERLVRTEVQKVRSFQT